MKGFDWSEFRIGDIAVHCNTEEKANDFLKQAHEHGIMWVGERSLLEENYYDMYMEDICYKAYFSTRMAFSSIESCINNSHKIIEWETNEMKEFTIEDLKVGMLVKTTSFDTLGYGMIMPSGGEGDLVAYKNERWGDIVFPDIMEVWGYCYYGYEAFHFDPDERELLYKREEPKKMTVKEICELIGFDVEIVKE